MSDQKASVSAFIAALGQWDADAAPAPEGAHS
jgi:hypothetical protein